MENGQSKLIFIYPLMVPRVVSYKKWVKRVFLPSLNESVTLMQRRPIPSKHRPMCLHLSMRAHPCIMCFLFFNNSTTCIHSYPYSPWRWHFTYNYNLYILMSSIARLIVNFLQKESLCWHKMTTVCFWLCP